MKTPLLAMSRRQLIAGVAFATLASTLPLPLVAEEVSRGGVLHYATLGLDTSDPHRHTGSIAVQQLYVEALTSIGPDGGVEPFLAESYEISDDGLTYTFTLREGVKFHNGDTMTAQDVVANFERVKENISGGWLASAMKLVGTVEGRDERTVVLTMTEPYAPLANLLSELWIVSPKSEGWDETITTPIGTGPFSFGEWQPQLRLYAPAHNDYWRGEMPYLEAVEANLRDDLDKASAMRAGEIHIASVPRDVAGQLGRSGDIRVSTLKDSTWYFVSFNNRNPRPPFDNPKVREAIMYAVDKQAFMNFMAGEDGVVTNQMVMPGHVYFDQELHDADRHAAPDLDKAKAMLAEAGVTPEEITIEFVSWQENYPQVVVQMVRQLGFKVNHVALDDLGAQNRLGQYDWDMNAMASGPRADIFLRFVRLMSDGPNPVLWGGIQDADLDATIKAAVAEPDEAERKALYLDAWGRVMDGYYTVVLGHAANTIAMREEVQGYEPGFTWSPNWATGGIAQTWLARD
ncbi:ABC transporter substrate-binding protein [Lutibaculum baratangense]|uniref:Substrate binding component of ABC transporter n=1 Tax=Lutibaculum baratangense AMV1 TaxID=631454 RepID=V4RP19_9HYPH|nr:ABC transporter substrate-binding protein [Lutibaculum baratangense]ESR24915.1 substrate binding component of ABC transporter [Lutibaculum baratangense AMV1]